MARSLLAIKMKGTNRTVVGRGGEEESLLGDPGSELRLWTNREEREKKGENNEGGKAETKKMFLVKSGLPQPLVYEVRTQCCALPGVNCERFHRNIEVRGIIPRVR